ncbi:DUF2254 domain-containing protein [Cyanobium sp. LEGE 06113]|uniref:DUF2254 domain-containing protein n=1 Tax=Cyanobium sp. LEGE 06113 TaxID=1297573 RepID=UPI0018823F56|nr:DUF2254 domain-containing protein [Cyanobium sp. LEGE 06113]MBE9153809.1 DUF2254 domain-containing protein [Cyanobium sp. LEGE 06113]
MAASRSRFGPFPVTNPQHPITLSLRGRLAFALNRLGEKLWAKPLLLCLVSLLGVWLAYLADRLAPGLLLPDISADTLETLLRIISSSMLVIAVFAAGSMLSAYASAGSTATPRALAVVVADDVSQYALSTFIGAFIFGIVALIAQMNGLYGRTGRFALFLLTLVVLAVVLLSFVTWVDRIARLGRVTNTIGRVEAVADLALQERARQPTLGGRLLGPSPVVAPGAEAAQPVLASGVGYLQRIDLGALQLLAQAAEAEIQVLCLPGAFITPARALAQVEAQDSLPAEQLERIAQTFLIGDRRTFDDDPRFGLVVLSEIASRALSPAVNDPGTAIHVIGSVVRLLTDWAQTSLEESRAPASATRFGRLWLPELALEDLLEDGFAATARDGAASLEVGLRLQKGLHQLSLLPLPALRQAAMRQAELALEHGELALRLERERERLRRAAAWVLPPSG